IHAVRRGQTGTQPLARRPVWFSDHRRRAPFHPPGHARRVRANRPRLEQRRQTGPQEKHLLVVVNQVRARFLLFVLLALCLRSARAQPLCLPTANRALFDPKGEERFFVGTAGKPWTTGTFGCVRSEGRQMHEGLDIRCLRRDSRGEPTDPVMASADGTVVYLSRKPALSNYGNYLVLRHQIGGVELYSLYAHLKNVRENLMIGQAVKAGEPLGMMGRTTNTREGISRDRAHVHFELDLLVNDRFPAWFRKASPAQRNDHGAWNGQNLLGLDPRLIFLEER